MPRRPREVFPGIPHHVTQRGNRKQIVFFDDGDRILYLSLLEHYCGKFGVSILAYCLMPNHVHLVVVPSDEDSLHLAFKMVHMRHATLINERFGWGGHLWQCRYFSSPTDDRYFQAAVRYVELNPVRAHLVDAAENYRWSSARHRMLGEKDSLIDDANVWNKFLPVDQHWRSFLASAQHEEFDTLRAMTKRNLPSGSDAFVSQLEKRSGQVLRIRPVGRPKENRDGHHL